VQCVWARKVVRGGVIQAGEHGVHVGIRAGNNDRARVVSRHQDARRQVAFVDMQGAVRDLQGGGNWVILVARRWRDADAGDLVRSVFIER